MRTGIPRAARTRLLAAGFALLPGAAVGAANGGAAPVPPVVAEEPHLGVVVRIAAYPQPQVNPARALRAVFDRIAALERVFSSFRDDSEVRLVADRAWRRPQPVSPELATVLSYALRLARETGGAFDPTLGRATALWRRERRAAEPASSRARRKAWSRTGWRLVAFHPDDRTVFLRRRGVEFDFGGIAKGFIADEALRTLARQGVRRALVAIAGDIVAGDPPPGKPGWVVGLDAQGARGSLEREVTLRHQAVSTSGGREQFYPRGTGGCSHILVPALAGCADAARAVSVVAPTGLEADGWATALASLGPAAGRALLAHRPPVRAYWAAATP